MPDRVSADMVALNADIVGYSKLLADDFDATTSAVESYHHLVSEQIAESRGTLVNFVGDNFMAVFDNATDAMRTAIAISAAIEARNAEISPRRQVRFRMGIDQGEVAISDDQYFGDALNIAARIQTIAPSGGVSVSGTVYRALDEPALRFKSLGRQDLKNIPEEVEVYQFTDLPADGRGTPAPGVLSLETPTIVILPIHTETVDSTVDAAAHVVRADIAHELSGVAGLNVIDAVSDSATTPDFSAKSMLETGVHQIGNKLRVYARIVDMATMNIVSSKRWTATSADLLTLSEQVGQDTARMVEVELIIGEPSRLYHDFLQDPEAVQLVYRGWYELTAGTPEGILRSIDHFSSVAEAVPDQPTGHTLNAFAHWMAAAQGADNDREGHLQWAGEAAQRGLETNDPTGLAETVMAANLMSQGKADEALEMVEHTQITRPTCDATYALEGSVRRYLGQWEKSVALLDKAMRLSPQSKPWYPTVQACSYYLGGRLEHAANTAEAVLEHQPRNLEALLVLTAAQVEMGMDRRAQATADLVKDRFPSVDVESWLEANPYQVREMVERWKSDLGSAGLVHQLSDDPQSVRTDNDR